VTKDQGQSGDLIAEIDSAELEAEKNRLRLPSTLRFAGFFVQATERKLWAKPTAA